VILGGIMNQNQDLQVLLDFYLYSDLDDKNYIQAYLTENNIDIVAIAENLTSYIELKQAELKLAEGRKFKEEYLEIVNAEKLNEAENEVFSTADSEMILAYRKSSGNLKEEDSDIQDEINKMDVLRKLTRKKNPHNKKQN